MNATEKLTALVEQEMMTTVLRIECFADPRVAGTYAVKAFFDASEAEEEMREESCFFLVSLSGRWAEEVVFKSWPPTFDGGRKVLP